MSAIRPWLRAQREARNRAAFVQLVADYVIAEKLGPFMEPAFDTMDGLPYELSPNHPLAGAGPIPLAPGSSLAFHRLVDQLRSDAIALSGLPGGGRWLPPRS
jgi:hypothetical protein